MRLVATAGNPVPDGAVTGEVTTRDGAALRFARWDAESRSRGAVCLLQGRAEFIEKYFETVRELKSRGFAVVTFDWRGQGLSARALTDPRKGHVESFRQYDADLEAVMAEVVLPHHRRPLIALAHSMGGALALRSAASGRGFFDRIILTAPMIGLPSLASSAFAGSTFRAMRAWGLGGAYIPGGRGTPMDLRPFAGNPRTSDPERYARNAGIVAAAPSLGLGSPTVAWVDAAFEALRELAEPGTPGKIREPMLIVTAGQDRIVSPAASALFASRSVAASLLTIVGARHEVLMERNDFRQHFWSAFDSFCRLTTTP